VTSISVSMRPKAASSEGSFKKSPTIPHII
jgi:hypothetical protein